MSLRLTGLTAAAHTPFLDDGSLHLAAIDRAAEHFLSVGVERVFICGTTGESHSLTVAERQAIAERWLTVARGTKLQVVVHVGSNCLADSAELARHAQRQGALAIAAVAPSYFKPPHIPALIACLRQISSAAPDLPFYAYDIPVMTGLSLSMAELLEQGQADLPRLNGLKFTNPDQKTFQFCLQYQGGRYDILWGLDEALLGALALGATGAIGSSYNFAAPIYLRMWRAFREHDLPLARQEQFRAARVIAALVQAGYLPATKQVMCWLGIPVGPPRLPLVALTTAQASTLRKQLDEMEFWSWIDQEPVGE
ncbi:MAG: dihydrodipicolinate synthase family protein [Pirellulales bacterium]|nr:dihydrodipicolinate synthase family protein [Pirellulales bacterium]